VESNSDGLTRSDIVDMVREIIADEMSISIDDVIEGAIIEDQLGADSLDMVEIIMAVEDDCDVIIPDKEAESMRSAKDIIDFVWNAKSGEQA
jgi:acyl carrier protein